MNVWKVFYNMVFALINEFTGIMSPENVLLVGSILLFLSVLAGKAGYKIGIPVLLLFLAVGMAVGSDGLGINFQNPDMAQFIGVMALSIILYSGGMDTKYSEIAPIWKRGVLLASLGVLATALITGGFIYVLTGWMLGPGRLSIWESMLLASVMSSTDSASVFSILRSQGVNIDRRLRATLEFESGSNDPMAFMLTIFFIGIVKGDDAGWGVSLMNFALQLSVGGFLGYALGRATLFALNRINVNNAGLYSVLLLALVFFTYTFTDLMKGNGYLAVYIAGLVVGNNKFVHKRTITNFFESFAWLWQIVMFLTLGLLVNPKDLLPVAGLGLAIGAFMIIFGRPLSVLLCLLPFKMPRAERAYISWVGLRGAVPIIFATYPMTAGVENAGMIFNVVFFITIMSLLIQGTTVVFSAEKLGLAKPGDPNATNFGVELSDDIKSTMSEIEVAPLMLQNGSRLMDISFPENTLVVMVKRNGNYFVPKGKTELVSGDKVLLIADDAAELEKVYAKFGVEGHIIGRS